MRMASKWTKKAEKSLFDSIGNYGLSWHQKHAGPPGENPKERRSSAAIYNKAYRMFGPGGLTRGSYSLKQIMDKTGYTRTHLFRAQHALNQKWKRMGPKGAYLITDDQLDLIVEWLKHDYWAKAGRRYCCAMCSTENRPHKALGLCDRCFSAYRRQCAKFDLPASGKKQLALMYKFRRHAKEMTDNQAKFIEKAVLQLKQGLALDERQLECLAKILVNS